MITSHVDSEIRRVFDCPEAYLSVTPLSSNDLHRIKSKYELEALSTLPVGVI